MKEVIFSLILFLVGFLIQVVVWRMRRPRGNHSIALSMIFSFAFLGGIFWVREFMSDIDILRAFFVFVSLVLAYLTTYSAVEVDSPSLLILLFVAAAGPEGLTPQTLSEKFSDDLLVGARLRDLVKDGMVEEKENNFLLTRKGDGLASFFDWYRGFLRAPLGG